MYILKVSDNLDVFGAITSTWRNWIIGTIWDDFERIRTIWWGIPGPSKVFLGSSGGRTRPLVCMCHLQNIFSVLIYIFVLSKQADGRIDRRTPLQNNKLPPPPTSRGNKKGPRDFLSRQQSLFYMARCLILQVNYKYAFIFDVLLIHWFAIYIPKQ